MSKKLELKKLKTKKTKLISSLIKLENDYNSLVLPNIKTADDWLYGFPIETLKELYINSGRRTRLGDMRLRSSLKANHIKIAKELDATDKNIKLAQIEVLSEMIEKVISDSEHE